MTSTKPVVLLAEELSPATIDALGPDFEIRQTDGADRSQLLSAIADVDAILVRSATQVDAEAIAAAKNLKVIARAGVGLDNVDIKAATQAGVMVVNAPTSNIVSAAELTVGHILSLARHIPQAMRRAQGRRVEALQVHRHRTLREEDRHHRPGPDRRPRRRPPEGLRHQDPRLRSLHHLGPRRPARRAAGDPRRAAGAVGLHQHPHAQDAGDRRHARRRVLQEDEEHRLRRQRRPRRPRRRGSALRRAARPAKSPVPASTSSSRSPAPTCRSSRWTTWWSPRTWARPRTKRRKRPASRWPSPSAWPWPGNWFPTP